MTEKFYKFTYKGLTKDRMDAQLAAQMEGLDPPEKRGQPLKYHILNADSEELKELKRKLTKEWLEGRKKEIVDGIRARDKCVSFNLRGAVHKFEKGKPVTLPESHDLTRKLLVLSEGVTQPKLHPGHALVQHDSFKMEAGSEKDYRDPGQPAPKEKPQEKPKEK
jgi:hypothetical protein